MGLMCQKETEMLLLSEVSTMRRPQGPAHWGKGIARVLTLG